jgi:hypothetical protein
MKREEFVREVRDCMLNRLSMKLKVVLATCRRERRWGDCATIHDACQDIIRAAEDEFTEICQSYRKAGQDG